MSKQPIFYRHDGVLKKINSDEIILLEVEDNYVKFHTADNFMMVRTSLEAALNQLPENHFLKVHRTFAVPAQGIVEIAKDYVILTGVADPIPVSKQYYPEFIKQITIIGSGLQDKKDGLAR